MHADSLVQMVNLQTIILPISKNYYTFHTPLFDIIVIYFKLLILTKIIVICIHTKAECWRVYPEWPILKIFNCRWFAFWAEFIASLIIFGIALFAVLNRDIFSPALLGLSITNAMQVCAILYTGMYSIVISYILQYSLLVYLLLCPHLLSDILSSQVQYIYKV